LAPRELLRFRRRFLAFLQLGYEVEKADGLPRSVAAATALCMNHAGVLELLQGDVDRGLRSPRRCVRYWVGDDGMWTRTTSGTTSLTCIETASRRDLRRRDPNR
jgi:hypothetical protein